MLICAASRATPAVEAEVREGRLGVVRILAGPE